MGGLLAGYAVVDVKVNVVDGSFHEVDSSELAFKMAGIFAVKGCRQEGETHPVGANCLKWRFQLLMSIRGDLLGDLNRSPW